MTRLVLIDCQSSPTNLDTYEDRKHLYGFTFPGVLGPKEVETARLYSPSRDEPEGPKAA